MSLGCWKYVKGGEETKPHKLVTFCGLKFCCLLPRVSVMSTILSGSCYVVDPLSWVMTIFQKFCRIEVEKEKKHRTRCNLAAKFGGDASHKKTLSSEQPPDRNGDLRRSRSRTGSTGKVEWRRCQIRQTSAPLRQWQKSSPLFRRRIPINWHFRKKNFSTSKILKVHSHWPRFRWAINFISLCWEFENAP